MRVDIRGGLATRKICGALLLAVAPIALVGPGGDVDVGQSGRSQVPPYTTIDLHPRGFDASEGSSTSGVQQAGWGATDLCIYGEKAPGQHCRTRALVWWGSASSVADLTPTGALSASASAVCRGQLVGYGQISMTETHALLWRGGAGNLVDLHPHGFASSFALGTSGEEQVGRGVQGNDEWPSHALVWHGSAASVVDLHPHRFTSSEAVGTSGGEQVGSGDLDGTGGATHALLWHGNAASVVDLHPSRFASSQSSGTSGGQQVGWGDLDSQYGPSHALLWRGSAASVIDLHPKGFAWSRAWGISGREQVGWGIIDLTTLKRHALLWRGSAGSVVDLHTFLPRGFIDSAAFGIDAAGDVVGVAEAEPEPHIHHAILWKRNAPKPSTPREQNTTGC